MPGREWLFCEGCTPEPGLGGDLNRVCVQWVQLPTLLRPSQGHMHPWLDKRGGGSGTPAPPHACRKVRIVAWDPAVTPAG